jgi:hypothetical protein
MPLAQHEKRRVVVRRAVAMSLCRLAYKPILQFEQSGNVTSHQHAARQRVVWLATLETGRQDNSATTRRLTLCHVVACNCKCMCCPTPIQISEFQKSPFYFHMPLYEQWTYFDF